MPAVINNSNQVQTKDTLVDLAKPLLFSRKKSIRMDVSTRDIDPNYDFGTFLHDLEDISGSSHLISGNDLENESSLISQEMLTREHQAIPEQLKLLDILKAYHQRINIFLMTTCRHEIKNYFLLSPKKPLVALHTPLQGKYNLHKLSIDKVNAVLKDQSNKILVPAVINAAVQLGIGKLIATYRGSRINFARYVSNFIDLDKGICTGIKYPAIASYWIDINYMHHGGYTIPLLALKFINEENQISYLFQGDDFLEQINNMVSHLVQINNTKVPEFLRMCWNDSMFIPNSIVLKKVDNRFLDFLLNIVANKILTTNSLNSKNFRIEILKTFYYEYQTLMYRFSTYNNKIKELLVQFKIDKISNIQANCKLLEPIEFTKDLIFLPIFHNNRRIKTIEYKYFKRYSNLVQAIENCYYDFPRNGSRINSKSTIRSTCSLQS